MFEYEEGSMGTRNQPPDAGAEVPTQPGTPPPGVTDPGSASASASASGDSDLMSQFEELDRCLARMDAVVSMLEADVERRAAALRAFAPEFSPTPAAGAAWRQQQKPRKGRRRAKATRNERARRGR